MWILSEYRKTQGDIMFGMGTSVVKPGLVKVKDKVKHIGKSKNTYPSFEEKFRLKN